jgi:hypothetical protein
LSEPEAGEEDEDKEDEDEEEEEEADEVVVAEVVEGEAGDSSDSAIESEGGVVAVVMSGAVVVMVLDRARRGWGAAVTGALSDGEVGSSRGDASPALLLLLPALPPERRSSRPHVRATRGTILLTAWNTAIT